MNDEPINVVSLKKYILACIKQAGVRMREGQRERMRDAYRACRRIGTNGDDDVRLLIKTLDSLYSESPYENSLVRGWPNPRWSLQKIRDKAIGFCVSEEYAEGFTGYPTEDCDDHEADERAIEQGDFYA